MSVVVHENKENPSLSSVIKRLTEPVEEKEVSKEELWANWVRAKKAQKAQHAAEENNLADENLENLHTVNTSAANWKILVGNTTHNEIIPKDLKYVMKPRAWALSKKGSARRTRRRKTRRSKK